MMTTIEKVDYVLNTIYNAWMINDAHLIHKLNEATKVLQDGTFQNINIVERAEIIELLKADGYIREFSKGNVMHHSITIKGILFKENGGYAGDINRQNVENILLETLEKRQMAYEHQQTYLTKVLAYATVAFVIIEFVRLLIEHSPFCR